jgi:hypothetical protein
MFQSLDTPVNWASYQRERDISAGDFGRIPGGSGQVQTRQAYVAKNLKIMGALRQQFIEDNQGQRIAVLMPIDLYNKMLEQLEEIELLEDDKKKTLFDVIDTYIREAKGRKAFAV